MALHVLPTATAHHPTAPADAWTTPHGAWAADRTRLAPTLPVAHEPAFERLRDTLESPEAAHLFRVLGARPLTHDEWSQLAGHAERWLQRFGHTTRAPDVFLPILGAPGIALPGWGRLVDHALAWMFERPAGTVHMLVFDLLARRDGVLDQASRDGVVRLWFHLLRRRGTEWFVRASRGAITTLAASTVHAADVACAIDSAAPRVRDTEASDDVVPTSPDVLAAWIRSRVREAAPEQADEVRRAFTLLQALSGHGEVFHAAAVLPSLLPMRPRTGDADLLHDGEVLAAVLAGHPLLTPSMRRRFVAECKRRQPQWPDTLRARGLLDVLEGMLPEHR